MTNLSIEAAAVLASLIRESEYDAGDGFRGVYLDNARLPNMTTTEYRAYLRVLSKAGLYRVVDGYAWGEVKGSK